MKPQPQVRPRHLTIAILHESRVQYESLGEVGLSERVWEQTRLNTKLSVQRLTSGHKVGLHSLISEDCRRERQAN